MVVAWGMAPATADTTSLDLLSQSDVYIYGEYVDGHTGYSVADAGDVNGDGLDDVVIGVPVDHSQGLDAGAAYVVFGSTSSSSVDLASLGARGFRINPDSGGKLGWSVAGAGDLNDDGMADVVVGAPFEGSDNGGQSGRAWVVFGRTSTGTVELGSFGFDLGAAGFRIDGADSGHRAGFAVAAAGDVNGDGRDDLLVGAPSFASTFSEGGAAYVIFGRASNTHVDLDSLGDRGYRVEGEGESDYTGSAVAGVGDVNSDGRDDVLVGAPYRGDAEGGAYVVYGKTSLTTVETGALGSTGYRIVGDADGTGSPVAGLGDINGDGVPDMGVAIPGDGSAVTLYAIFGGGTTGDVNLSSLEADGLGVAIHGSAEDDGFATSIAAGDLDGDAYADVLIGTPASDNNARSSSGSVYVLFGSDIAGVDVGDLGSDGFRIDGASQNEGAGTSVAVTDGFGSSVGQIVIGAPAENDFTHSAPGNVYVVNGVTEIPRSVSLKLKKHLVAKGTVTASEPECVNGVTVKVQRKKSSGWKTVGKDTTDADGDYKEALDDKADKYRAKVSGFYPEIRTKCESDKSSTKKHSH